MSSTARRKPETSQIFLLIFPQIVLKMLPLIMINVSRNWICIWKQSSFCLDCVAGTVVRLRFGRPRGHVSILQVRDSPKCIDQLWDTSSSLSTGNRNGSPNILSIKRLAVEDGYTPSSETQVNTLRTELLNCLNASSRGLTFRHRASCI